MKPVVVICVLLIAIAVASVWAQEKVPLEEAQRGAKLVTKAAIEDPPFKMDLELDDPVAIKSGDVGILVIPSKDLSKKTLAKTENQVAAIGQLWMLKVAPAIDNKVVPNSKLRLLTVRDGDEEHQVHVCFLGAKKNDKGALDLVVYAKDKQPLLRLPLEKINTDQEFPIELQGKKRDDESGILTLSILGEYKADLLLMKQAD